MIPLPPPDPALGAMEVVLHGDAMGAILGAQLPDCASGRLQLCSCRPYSVKYKPGKYCFVVYNLTFSDSSSGTLITALAHSILYPRRRSAKRWATLQRTQLIEQARHMYPQAPDIRAIHLPELGALVQLYPVDVNLPELLLAGSAAIMRRKLHEALPGVSAGEAPGCEVELIRYKPGSRAVLRYRLHGSEERVVYGKLQHDAGNRALYAVERALQDAGVAVPTPLAYLPDLQLTLHAEAPGTWLKQLRGTAEFVNWMEPVAAALARLHATPTGRLTALLARAGSPRSPQRRRGRRELQILRPLRLCGATIGPTLRSSNANQAGLVEVAQTIAALIPGLAREVAQLAERLIAHLNVVQGPTAIIHGDFYEDQLFVSDTGVVLLDFEEAQLGDPLLDVGHFLAQLSLRGNAEHARAAFLDAYAAFHPRARKDALLFEARAVLSLALGPFQRLRPAWPEKIERRIRLATHRLDEYLDRRST